MPLTLGWARDSRDSALVPTTRPLQARQPRVGAAGDVQYLRANCSSSSTSRSPAQFTLGLNAELGWGKGLGGQPYPIFKNFYGGGLGSVRGFEQGSLGPVDATGAYIGGNRRLNVNAELYVPVPGRRQRQDAAPLRLHRRRQRLGRRREGPLRQPARVGRRRPVSWISPVGPLKLSYGTPMRKQPDDRIQRLQFQIGTAF